MGYSRNPVTVARMSSYLSQLTGATTIEFPTSDPRRLAYQIRDAMHAADVCNVEPYASLRRTWEVKEDYERMCIVCSSRLVRTDKIILSSGEVAVAMDALLRRGYETEMFVVPRSLSDEELLPIWNWMQADEHGWYIIRVEEDERTMLTRRKGREMMAEWKPESEV